MRLRKDRVCIGRGRLSFASSISGMWVWISTARASGGVSGTLPAHETRGSSSIMRIAVMLRIYNPAGSIEAQRYRFPHSDSSFQLILFTSVLTHTLEDTMRNYIREAARLLAPRGVVYATFFLYESPELLRAGIDRHEAAFPFVHGRCMTR